MTAKIKDMTEGRPLSLIITLALPLMVGIIFQQPYTVVDTMVVGSSTTLSVICGILFLAIGQIAARPVLVLLNTPAVYSDHVSGHSHCDGLQFAGLGGS